MKKQILIAVVTLFPAIGFAKMDFNTMIAENNKAQEELHSNIKNHVAESRIATKRDRIIVVESAGKSFNAPSRDVAMKKDKRSRASEQRQFERLASEFNSSEF